MDIMGSAMAAAMTDMKRAIGMKEHFSDDEEKVENDDDYQTMNEIKQKYLNVRRRDSD